jgi:hypothetical protein
MFVVSWFAVNSLLEEGNHVLVGLLVKVVHLVPLVQHIGHQVRRWRVGDG